jgi:prolyl oligopeptidase
MLWQRAPSAVLCTLAIIAMPAGGSCAEAPRAGGLHYPAALRGTTVDDYHGTSVPDPYRGLEDLDSAATRDWVDAESALTQHYLDALPHRAQLRSRLAQLYNFERFGLPFQAHGRTFYTRNTGLQNQSVLYVAGSAGTIAAGSAGAAAGAADARQAHIALDPNSLSKDGSLGVTGYVASHDGRLIAYGVSVSGSDWTDWHLRELSSGRDLPDVIRYTKYYAPVFSNDDRGLYYSAFPAPAPGSELSAQDIGDAVYYHALGTVAAADRKLVEIAGHPDWQYEPRVSDDGRWLVVTAGEGEVGDKGLENIYLVDLAGDPRAVTPVAEGFGAAYVYAGSDAGRLYFLTTLGAPNGKVIAIDPLQAHADPAPTVIAEGADAIDLTAPSVTLVDHQLIVRSMHDAHSRIVTYSLDGTRRREIVLPGTGTANGFAGRAEDRATFYSYADLITPPRVYRYDLEAGTSQVFRSPRAAFNPQSFQARQVFYPGKDGTRIPMMLAYRKGLRFDGRNPLLLYGYGGFGIPVLPAFNPALIAWLELGGVYAIANIRGGGEYGEVWHRQANRHHKQVVFDDFIAAAEWLIAQRYTATPRLAIRGESNGGLLVGACITQRPELYGAAIAGVGVMDMLRFDRFGQGEGWTGEYGSPQEPADFAALYAYSPLHQVRPGTRYPATLIITGDHDTRVMPMHSFKFAAAMQAAQSGSEPVLLYIERSSGHGGGPTVSQAIEQSADIYAFLVDRLQMQLNFMSTD